MEPVRHPPNLEARGVQGGGFDAVHIDGDGRAWPVCECTSHPTEDDALDCARARLTVTGREAFETYNHAVGGVTWNGLPIPGWDDVTEHVRDGWRVAALAARLGQTLR